MKFMIDRASLGAEDVKPYDNAVQLVGGGYGIKLNNLEDLMEVIEKIDCPIIVYPGKGGLPLLQIYDDYIE